MNNVDHKVTPAGFGTYLLGQVQIILNPAQGWMDAERLNHNARSLLVAGLCPWLGITALTALTGAFVRQSITLTDALLKGAVDFTGYFVSVFLCRFLLTELIDRYVESKKLSEARVLTLTVYVVGAMATITMLNNLFPFDLALLSFLPLYIIYIIWSARYYMGIPPESNLRFMLVSLAALFAPPYLLSYILSIII